MAYNGYIYIYIYIYIYTTSKESTTVPTVLTSEFEGGYLNTS